ncbi:MAG: CatA-like O-acetyltransferase [Clostridia bacterium]|nr:CatA-like O-acetyltransferase [Clostridia bacterium]
MSYRTADLEKFPRRELFEHFSEMYFPFVQVTSQVDITGLYARVKAERLPFFLSFVFCLGRAANRVPELRQRIRNGGIVEYDGCGLSYTVAAPDGTYRYCNIRCDLPFDRYLAEAKEAQRIAEQNPHLTEDEDPESCFYLSSLPWVDFTGISLPFPDNRFSVPSFMMGKYRESLVPAERDGTVIFEKHMTMPVCIQVHHALADGRHIGLFFEGLTEELKRFAEGSAE